MKITQNSLLLFTQVFMQNTFLLTDKMCRCCRKLRNFLKITHVPQFAVNIKLLASLPRLSSFIIETKKEGYFLFKTVLRGLCATQEYI